MQPGPPSTPINGQDTVEISIESWPKRSHQINRTLRRPEREVTRSSDRLTKHNMARSPEKWPKTILFLGDGFYHDPPCQRNTPTYATSRWLNPTLTLFTSTLLENSSAASTLPVGVVGDRLLTSVHFASITVARAFGDPVTLSAPDPDRTASKNDSPPLRYQTWSPRPPKERNHRYSSSCQDVGGVGQQNWHKKWHETKRLTWLTSKIANEYPAPHRENAPMLMLQARISCPTATWRVCTTCNSAEYWRPLMRCSEGIWRWNWALAIGSDNLMMWIQHQCGDQ